MVFPLGSMKYKGRALYVKSIWVSNKNCWMRLGALWTILIIILQIMGLIQ